MTTVTDALLPCPFCGGMPMQARESRDERFGYRGINTICCNDCTARVQVEDPEGPNGWANGSGMPEAISAWNTRPAEHRARVEGAEIMREAAAKSFEIPDGEQWDDCCIDTLYDYECAIRNLDPAAILEAHTRAKEGAE